MPMNVILLERVPKLGQMGDVVKVKPGFARNFLLPQKKALRATKDNITYFESQRKVLEAQNLERRSEAEAVGGKMKDLKVTLIRQASEALQLYGSVTSRDIADGADRRRRQDRAQPGRARQADQGAGRPQDQDPPPSRGHGRDHRRWSPARPTRPSSWPRAASWSPRPSAPPMEAAEAAQRAAEQAAALFEAKPAPEGEAGCRGSGSSRRGQDRRKRREIGRSPAFWPASADERPPSHARDGGRFFFMKFCSAG